MGPVFRAKIPRIKNLFRLKTFLLFREEVSKTSFFKKLILKKFLRKNSSEWGFFAEG